MPWRRRIGAGLAVAVGLLGAGAVAWLLDGGDEARTVEGGAPSGTSVGPGTASPNPAPAATTPATTISPSFDAGPTVTAQAIEEQPDDTEVSIRYPRVAGLDPEVATRVNRAVETHVDEVVASFLASVEEVEAGPVPHSIWVRFGTGAITPQVLSLRFDESTYSGGAHPLNTVTTMTFDLTTGTQVGLDDLFADGILERLSELAVATIDEEYGTGDWATEGAAPTTENLRRFVLHDDRLVLWFDNYQVGPYAIGTPSVDVPYDELRELIPDTGIVAGLAG